MPSPPSEPTPILLALQGGGSHGALAWGVLDRLLEEPALPVRALSGTSAGAMNAAVTAAALAGGGPEAARAALRDFWRAVSRAGALSPIRRTPHARLAGRWSLEDSPAYRWFDLVSRMASPYQLNPADHHPLRSILERQVDLAALNDARAPRLYITATNVRTGLPRVFTQPDLGVDAILASAALPQLFRAVEIEGEAYWDGGYVGNPTLFPLIRDRAACDLLLVQTNPFERPEVPRTAHGIQNRVNEITFNAALLKELRALLTVRRLTPGAAPIRLHRVHADADLARLSPSSKLDVEWDYLGHLFERGRAQAGAFLERDGARIGRDASFDPSAMLEGIMGEADLLAPRVAEDAA